MVAGTRAAHNPKVTGQTNGALANGVKPLLANTPRMTIESLNVYYGEMQALKDISLSVYPNEILSLIGPSGCGKSTFLRCLNRMNDVIDGCCVEGRVLLDEADIYDSSLTVEELRERVGMVFQKPNPFPKSIYDNVAYGPRLHGLASDRDELDGIVEKSLKKAGLWKEVENRLHESGTGLSGGQQQRLCIARAIAVEPEIILMDEPCSALDPIATGRIEELMNELKESYSIVIVTHSMQQAFRVSDKTAFFLLGELIEKGTSEEIFKNARDQRTRDYILGKFG